MPESDQDKRRRDRERRRRRVEARLAAGVCSRCARHRPVEGGRTCEACRRKRRVRDRACAEKRRAAGIRRVRDPKARRAEYARARRRAAERVAAGLCSKCGSARPEPGRRLCARCGDNRRRRERARYAAASSAGAAYGGKSPEAKRRSSRDRGRRRRQQRQAGGRCIRCGLCPPVQGGASCEPCLEKRRAEERTLYKRRRVNGRCVRCETRTFEGVPLCGPCTVADARKQPVRNAAARRRYAQRTARQICTHCGKAPSFGASRCQACACRAYERSEHVRGLPVYGDEFTVVHAASGEILGVYEQWEDVVLCVSFAKLSFDDVEILQEHAPMRSVLTGFS